MIIITLLRFVLSLCVRIHSDRYRYISIESFFFFKAGDGDKYYRDTHLTETVTSHHNASLYRPVDFRLPVGGGQFGDISGTYDLIFEFEMRLPSFTD
jgi:hypothetical protein